MKALKITVITILGLIAASTAFYGWLGGFRTPEFRSETQGGEILVYQEMEGDYSKSGAVMDEIYQSLIQNYGVKTKKGFGIYYDNPQKVEKTKLRSDIGCILEMRDSSKLAALEKKYKIKIAAKGNYIVTEFPFKNKLSVIVGVIKVYPAMNEYIKINGYNPEGPVTEIYDMPNKLIVYRKAIDLK